MSKSNYVKLATDAGDQFLATLAEGQETFLKSVATLSSWTPPTPPAPAVALPTPHEVTEAYFAFVQKLIKQQKEFSDKLFAANVPASA
jgi:hypothetical protein